MMSLREMDSFRTMSLRLCACLALCVAVGLFQGSSAAFISSFLAVPDPEPVPVEVLIGEDETRTLRLSAVGDCTLGSDSRFGSNSEAKTFFDVARDKDTSYFFSGVSDILLKDDVSFANLETVLTANEDPDNREPKPEQGNRAFWFYGPPENVNILKQGGIDIVSTANNHSHDYRDEGYADTVAVLKKAGVPYAGYDEEAIVTVNGIRIGSLGLNLLGKNERGVDLDRFKDDAAASIQDLKAVCDLIVVQIHWGTEGSNIPDPEQIEMGHWLVDAGADLVLGHHPHMLQPTERYKDRYIVYSLGNFCFGGNQQPSINSVLTAIWQMDITLTSEGLSLGEPRVIPCSITSDPSFRANDYRPVPLEDDVLIQNVMQRLRVMTTGELTAQMGLQHSYAYVPLTRENAGAMVDAQKYISGLKKDVRYFTGANFMERPVYVSDTLYLRKCTAEKLKRVVADLQRENLFLLVWDAYRPPEAQWLMWEVVLDERYIANPHKGFSKHSYGSTVDVTLADAQGKALEMPTDFDDFTIRASHDLNTMTGAAKENVLKLRHVMEANGFVIYYNEWWHYTDREADVYGPVLDVETIVEEPML